jgi:RHS repeat-associated protein
MLAVRKLAGVAPAMLARAILPMLRRYVGSALPALVIALLLALVTGTSWAQTRTPDAPDIPAVPGTNTEMPTPDKPGLALDLSDAATGVNISAPSTMAPGSTAYVTVTIRNSGTTTWYPGLPNPYRLGSQNPQDNRTWGVGRVELGSTVAPGGNAVFGFTITAPSTPGTYDFGWGMLREGLYWFGGNIASSIKVAAPAPVYDAQLISASVPSSMTAGGYYKVSITLKNTGNTTWTSPDFSLANSDDSQTFGISRVSMNPSTVAPGQSSTFDFQVRAPAAAGTYTFQWGMVWEYHQRFGQNSTTYITVSVPTTPKPTISPSHTAMVAGQAFTMSWSTTNATSVSHICSAAGTGYNVNEALAPSGSRSMTAQAGWVNYPSTCTWTANGPGGTTTVSETLTTTAVPTSKPTISVSRPSLVAGQSFTTSWSTTNATALTHVCTASGTGYKVNESLAVNGSRTLTAQSAWVGYPSSCTWTASGAGGSATYTETMTTVAGTNSSVTYIHTDGLGSPVARSDASGRLISRTRYEPYGYVASGVTPTIGFTGHVNDVDTGLTYMQQRYYDPVAGRFLSTDPVTTDANTGGSFNRYAYANNSPYKYIDPNGRWAFLLPLVPYLVDATVVVIGHYVLPGRQQREDSARKLGNAILNNGNKDSATKSDTPEAPVPDATGGERVGKGPRIWNKPSNDPVGEANRDFDRKFPGGENVDDKGNGVRVGTLPDGKRVIVRPESSDRSGNLPTIEIQNAGGSKSLDKIRYPQREDK